MLLAIVLGTYITAGTPTDGDPAVVVVQRAGTPICTATIISERAAVTAAHCNGDEIVVGLEHFTIAETLRHDRFDRETLANDVAVVISERAMTVTPAERSAGGTVEPGLLVRVVGFGFGSVTDQAQTKREGYSMVVATPPSQLQLAPSPSQPCYGDSGGPVFDGTRLVAVVSWGDTGCSKFAIAQRIDLDTFVDDGVAVAEQHSTGGCDAGTGHSVGGLAALALLRRRGRRRSCLRDVV